MKNDSKVLSLFKEIILANVLGNRHLLDFPVNSDGKKKKKKKICLQCRRPGFDPWLGRFSGEGHGNPLQYSRLGNPTDRGAWWVAV